MMLASMVAAVFFFGRQLVAEAVEKVLIVSTLSVTLARATSPRGGGFMLPFSVKF